MRSLYLFYYFTVTLLCLSNELKPMNDKITLEDFIETSDDENTLQPLIMKFCYKKLKSLENGTLSAFLSFYHGTKHHLNSDNQEKFLQNTLGVLSKNKQFIAEITKRQLLHLFYGTEVGHSIFSEKIIPESWVELLRGHLHAGDDHSFAIERYILFHFIALFYLAVIQADDEKRKLLDGTDFNMLLKMALYDNCPTYIINLELLSKDPVFFNKISSAQWYAAWAQAEKGNVQIKSSHNTSIDASKIFMKILCRKETLDDLSADQVFNIIKYVLNPDHNTDFKDECFQLTKNHAILQKLSKNDLTNIISFVEKEEDLHDNIPCLKGILFNKIDTKAEAIQMYLQSDSRCREIFRKTKYSPECKDIEDYFSGSSTPRKTFPFDFFPSISPTENVKEFLILGQPEFLPESVVNSLPTLKDILSLPLDNPNEGVDSCDTQNIEVGYKINRKVLRTLVVIMDKNLLYETLTQKEFSDVIYAMDYLRYKDCHHWIVRSLKERFDMLKKIPISEQKRILRLVLEASCSIDQAQSKDQSQLDNYHVIINSILKNPQITLNAPLLNALIVSLSNPYFKESDSLSKHVVKKFIDYVEATNDTSQEGTILHQFQLLLEKKIMSDNNDIQRVVNKIVLYKSEWGQQLDTLINNNPCIQFGKFIQTALKNENYALLPKIFQKQFLPDSYSDYLCSHFIKNNNTKALDYILKLFSRGKFTKQCTEFDYYKKLLSNLSYNQDAHTLVVKYASKIDLKKLNNDERDYLLYHAVNAKVSSSIIDTLLPEEPKKSPVSDSIITYALQHGITSEKIKALAKQKKIPQFFVPKKNVFPLTSSFTTMLLFNKHYMQQDNEELSPAQQICIAEYHRRMQSNVRNLKFQLLLDNSLHSQLKAQKIVTFLKYVSPLEMPGYLSMIDDAVFGQSHSRRPLFHQILLEIEKNKKLLKSIPDSFYVLKDKKRMYTKGRFQYCITSSAYEDCIRYLAVDNKPTQEDRRLLNKIIAINYPLLNSEDHTTFINGKNRIHYLEALVDTVPSHIKIMSENSISLLFKDDWYNCRGLVENPKVLDIMSKLYLRTEPNLSKRDKFEPHIDQSIWNNMSLSQKIMNPGFSFESKMLFATSVFLVASFGTGCAVGYMLEEE